jgi:hypothetical protein
MESRGIPTAPIVTARFAEYINKDAEAHGVPLRFSYPPYPVDWMPRETIHGYVQGDDPVTGRPLMPEVVDALLRPLTDREIHPVVHKKARRPRLLPADTEAGLNRLFLERGWTDGLPIVLPTEERVAEMLTGTDHDSQEVVGRMSVTTHEEKLEYTVEKVAVNAVIAGARPEHFPVILALAASQRPSLPSSTGSWAGMVMVNGPVRNQIGMNAGGSALGPFNYANSVIGRAWTLLSINLGDVNLSENFTGSTGNNMNYNNMCCAENEELSPWEPFHVQNGFKPTESTVSLFRGWSLQGFSVGPPKRMAQVMTGLGFGNATFILDPLVAKSLKKEGYNTKQELAEFLAKEGKGTGQGGRPLNVSSINLVVVGGEWNPIWLTTDFVYTQTESIDKWMPRGGIRQDAHPLRMPAQANCADGVCGLPNSILDEIRGQG